MAGESPAGILQVEGASFREALAAREIRRYVYLRTGQLLDTRTGTGDGLPAGDWIVVGSKDQPLIRKLAAALPAERELAGLGKECFLLETIARDKSRILLIAGGDDTGALYGAYRFAERLGVRFYLHGDVIPDRRATLDIGGISERHKPLFPIRGTYAWDIYYEGRDPWNVEDYQAFVAQHAKMRLNLAGFRNGVPIPLTWIGLPEDLNEDGTPTFAYPTGFWIKGTKGLQFGAEQLFPQLKFQSDLMEPYTKLWAPSGSSSTDAVEMVVAYGKLQKTVYEQAYRLGIKIAVATTCPPGGLPVELQKRIREKTGKEPIDVADRLMAGTFRRIMKTFPIDYFLLETPEVGMRSSASKEVEDIKRYMLAAVRAAEDLKTPFRLLTTGWMPGTGEDPLYWDKNLPKSMGISALGPTLGQVRFHADWASIRQRDKWWILWLEDDSNFVGPSLWAGRTRFDAADALRQGCTGLLGQVWRTRETDHEMSAMAGAAWDQSGFADRWKPDDKRGRSKNVKDFYDDWALQQFGPKAAESISRIFQDLDGQVPIVSKWSAGGAGIILYRQPPPLPWATTGKSFLFVEQLEALRPGVQGRGNLARYDWWLDTFRFARDIAKLRCLYDEFNTALKKVKAVSDPAERLRMGKDQMLPIYSSMLATAKAATTSQLQAVSTFGEMGTVLRCGHQVRALLSTAHEECLTNAWGVSATNPAANAPEVLPSTRYAGSARLIVPTPRDQVSPDEPLVIKVFWLGNAPPAKTELCWRRLGGGDYRRSDLRLVKGNRYAADLTAAVREGADIEYYITATTADGQALTYPATAPDLNAAVVVLRDRQPSDSPTPPEPSTQTAKPAKPAE